MSSAWNQQNQGYPAVPPTLNANNNLEMHDYNSHQGAPPNTIPNYTPYLGLRARLSQVWINRWTILLILIIVRLILATKEIDSGVTSAKGEALSACTSVEHVGSAMASMPHYLAGGVNSMAADGITKAVNGMMGMLMLTVTGLEEIILFYINMMTSTYVCLITLVISGSLHAAIDMIEQVGDFMNKSISGITGDMASDVKGFQDTLNTFLGALSIPTGLLGSSKTPPKIDLSSQIDKLNSIQIDPTKMDADLTKLNASIPTFADVQNFTNSVIRFPFEEVKKLINESLAAYTFDKSVFPTPEKKALTFCSDNSKINDFFSGLTKVISKARTIFLVVLTLAAVLVCVPMAYREIWRWRTMQQRAELAQKQAFDPMDVIYIASRPFTSTAGIKAASKFKSTKRQILTRWCFAYATTLPVLFVLGLGLAGLFSALCQTIILKTIEKEVPKIANEVGGFADEIVGAINNSSAAWAHGANTVINTTNAKINNDVFGWVNTSTTAVNNTLNTFTDEMNKALNVTFGGTILYKPVQGLMECLIGLKIAGIEKGLTWVHDHAHVDFPGFRPDVFSLGSAASVAPGADSTDSFLSSPGSAAADDVTNAVVKVVNKLQEGIRTEAIIAACLVSVYFFIVLIGVVRVLIAMWSRDKTRAEGGPTDYTGNNRGTVSPRSPPQNYETARFPQFGGPVSAVQPEKSPNANMAWGAGGAGGAVPNERFGDVGLRSVEAHIKPGHERKSSHGYLDEKRQEC
ncbi:uncharacterized protein BP5553_03568 [Venustampulla echinocandica]|uniref:Plasma membrane fusion protein PRM1 n=1 Tax=Venustampulla echinocandica TaxID=2656787 RepID=A0A370TUT0_9HELO|nr:uncharacterized protein BP5553_03568 [Venustampulla echinocandica]RDL39228.1 hypothetical protein BP5553_03568 [Venustampulla echinocandica]